MSRIAGIVAPLFVPADRPERFAKAARSGADAVILDLEDAVPPARKEVARAALETGFTVLPVIVRINAAGTSWFEDDLAAIARLPIAAVMLPKADSAAPLMRVVAIAPVIALVETVRGVADARQIASSGHVERLAFGSVDYAADLGCDHVRDALASARADVVVASRLANLPQPLDGVTTDVTDAVMTQGDARHARALGFGGKLLIHPRQVSPTWTGFMPGRDEIAWAERVLGSDDGAAAVDGAMVDEPVRIRARTLLDRAGRSTATDR